MCTNRTLNKHIIEAMRLKNEIATLKAQLERHTDTIKEELTDRGLEAYQCGKDDSRVTVAYKEIKKNRLDQKALKAEMPDIVKAYTVEATERRFTMHH